MTSANVTSTQTRALRHPLPEYVAVAIPAHEEQDHVIGSVTAARRAAKHPLLNRSMVDVIVVADACSDTTAERAAAAGALVVETDLHVVGAARRAGLALALERSAGLDPSDIWLANTDADTLVPPDWIAGQLGWRDRHADAVAGTVAVRDWREQPRTAKAAWTRLQKARGLGLGHGHVHGANLGLSAAAYLDVGGMPSSSVGEDVELWRLLRRAGKRTMSVGDITVVTSARRESRAAGGFSDLLRTLGQP